LGDYSVQKESTTDFGFDEIPASEKQGRVGSIFDSVADNYDLMNDVMSFGIHRLWKKFTLELCGLKAGHCVLDLAGGTGDMAIRQAAMVGESGQVYLADINSAMLQQGRDRVIDEGLVNRIIPVQCNAEILPFTDNSFDCITIAFGLRNVTDKLKALSSMRRILRPGGRLCVLEFSKPADWLAPIYDTYSFKLLPKIGKIVSDDEDSYRYLAESIRMHPDQETMKQMMVDAGFERCDYHNMTAGIVALHSGYKF
jgi:demethylmenaquinone methyltransferase/2-methoxy-6-polyprenyl-1,4-benzoquinol methylase